MTDGVSLDGRTVVAVENEGGDVGSDTRMTFTQDGTRLSAEYSGGDIAQGYLLGTVVDGEWDVRYVQVGHEGETATGHSVGTVEELPDGRVRIEDEWEWESKPGGGRSLLEEV
jgi:hypothetical protein